MSFIFGILIFLLIPATPVLAASSQTLKIKPPTEAATALLDLKKACEKCVEHGFILFGDDDSHLSKKFFDHFFQGSKPKGFMLALDHSRAEFIDFMREFRDLSKFKAALTKHAQQLKLVVFDKDFSRFRLLTPIAVPEVTMSQSFFDRFLKTQSYCEKGQCSPKLVMNFRDTDGELIRLRAYAGSPTTIWRNSGDIRKKDVSSKVRRGVLYWGHSQQRVLLY